MLCLLIGIDNRD